MLCPFETLLISAKGGIHNFSFCTLHFTLFLASSAGLRHEELASGLLW